MARALRDEQQPSSSVSRMLELSAAARSVVGPVTRAPVERIPAPERAVPTQIPSPASVIAAEVDVASTRATRVEPTGEQPNLNREFVLTASTNEAFERLLETFRRATGTRMTSSHLARAVLKGVSHCMDQIEREAQRLGRLKLPSNARGREFERERFEARIADAFVSGVRSAAAFDGE